jgi:hypothetical protein
MGGHEIRYRILLHPIFFIYLIKLPDKFLIGPIPGFAHVIQNLIRNMFRGHPQLSAYMKTDQFI